MPVPLHANHVAPPSLPTLAVVGAVAGLFATFVMNVPMKRLREGQSPPFVVARAFTGDPLVDVTGRAATAVHYVGGTVAGFVFGLVAALLTGPLSARPWVPGVALPLLPSLVALAVVFGLLYGAFAYLALPRFGGSARDRAPRVRRDWAVSVGVYAVTLAVLVPTLLALFT